MHYILFTHTCVFDVCSLFRQTSYVVMVNLSTAPHKI
jgi:hypothetical protein